MSRELRCEKGKKSNKKKISLKMCKKEVKG
jgi:hypothetical protein